MLTVPTPSSTVCPYHSYQMTDAQSFPLLPSHSFPTDVDPVWLEGLQDTS